MHSSQQNVSKAHVLDVRHILGPHCIVFLVAGKSGTFSERDIVAIGLPYIPEEETVARDYDPEKIVTCYFVPQFSPRKLKPKKSVVSARFQKTINSFCHVAIPCVGSVPRLAADIRMLFQTDLLALFVETRRPMEITSMTHIEHRCHASEDMRGTFHVSIASEYFPSHLANKCTIGRCEVEIIWETKTGWRNQLYSSRPIIDTCIK